MHLPRTSILAGALVLSALVPAGASASTVTLEGDVLVVRTDPGSQNVVRASGPNSGSRGAWWFRDISGDEVAEWTELAPGCRNIADAGQIECTPRGGGVRIEAGDGDDAIAIDGETAPLGEPAVLLGGDGNDRISGRDLGNARDTLDGGTGNDTVTGGAIAEAVLGGDGNDTIGGTGGADEVRGGDGNDKLSGDAYGPAQADVIDGGPGLDKLENEWVQREATPAIAVTLDGVADDGRPGEGDNVVAVEDIYSTAPVSLTAGPDAVIFKVFNTALTGSTLVGGPAGDMLSGFDWHDTIRGAGGDDTIEGGYGNDAIDAGAGRDTVVADAADGCNYLQCRQPQGNDTVEARDGEVDNIDCGIGEDRVTADAADVVAASCETVDRGAAVIPDTGPDTTGGPAGDGGPQPACVVPKVRAGTALAAARKRIAGGGCKVAVRRVRSKVRKGRVVGLSLRRGRRLRAVRPGARLAPGATVIVRVSRGSTRSRGGRA